MCFFPKRQTKFNQTRIYLADSILKHDFQSPKLVVKLRFTNVTYTTHINKQPGYYSKQKLTNKSRTSKPQKQCQSYSGTTQTHARPQTSAPSLRPSVNYKITWVLPVSLAPPTSLKLLLLFWGVILFPPGVNAQDGSGTRHFLLIGAPEVACTSPLTVGFFCVLSSVTKKRLSMIALHDSLTRGAVPCNSTHSSVLCITDCP